MYNLSIMFESRLDKRSSVIDENTSMCMKNELSMTAYFLCLCHWQVTGALHSLVVRASIRLCSVCLSVCTFTFTSAERMETLLWNWSQFITSRYRWHDDIEKAIGSIQGHRRNFQKIHFHNITILWMR